MTEDGRGRVAWCAGIGMPFLAAAITLAVAYYDLAVTPADTFGFYGFMVFVGNGPAAAGGGAAAGLLQRGTLTSRVSHAVLFAAAGVVGYVAAVFSLGELISVA